MNTTNILPRIILVIVLAASSLAFLVQPAEAASCAKYHTVQKGENLYGIGLKYGISWTKLEEINILVNPRLIFAGQKLCVSLDSGTTPTPKPPSGGSLSFKIVSVVKDNSVTIETANLPANDAFDVLMGPFGTKGINGKKVETLSSGKGGVITANFKIPDLLHGSSTIAIRLQSPTSD